MASYLFIQKEMFESDWLEQLLKLKFEIRKNFYRHTTDKFILQIILTKGS